MQGSAQVSSGCAVTEFTGERVIPGQVNPDLWNEHFSRYVFASRYCVPTSRVLDIGCGTGYGLAELARIAAHITGLDVSAEAVEHARINFAAAHVELLIASATMLPLAGAAYDLVTAFEVIEHLESWRSLLTEAERVLGPGGVFLVSTPNKLYYAESRKQDGPNPYHAHEFEYGEFRDALRQVFPHVEVLLQNRSECLAFTPAEGSPNTETHSEPGNSPAEHANFFIAVCSTVPLRAQPAFLYVPAVTNVLREREHHIEKLGVELDTNRQWLVEVRNERAALMQHLDEQKAHVEKQNRWAQQLDTDLRAAQQRIAALQDEFHAEQKAAQDLARNYEAKVAALERENLAKTAWAQDTEQRLTYEIEQERARITEVLTLLDAAEATVVERTDWALSLQNRMQTLESQLAMVRASRFVRIGRTVGIGPRL